MSISIGRHQNFQLDVRPQQQFYVRGLTSMTVCPIILIVIVRKMFIRPKARRLEHGSMANVMRCFPE